MSGGHARVVADGSLRTLLVDGLEASVVDLDDPLRLDVPYVRRMAAVLELAGAREVLHLGGGGCSLARWLAAARPGARSLVFEVDPEVVAAAREEMGAGAVPGLRIAAADARTGLSGLRPRSFDAVAADVFVGPRVPDHLCTVEALEEVARVLRPGGAYVANLIDEAPLRRARRQLASVIAVLGEATLIAERAVLRGRRAGNLVVAAGRTLPAARLARRAGGADVLAGEAAAVWCGDARPLRD